MVKNLIGNTYGRLTVISRAESTKRGQSMWNCKCDCGQTVTVRSDHLKGGVTKSCGCYQKEWARESATAHGSTGTRLYGIWLNMRNRCNNPLVGCYSDYGGRGITVCPEWRDSFETFRDWALANGYQDNLTIERKDTNGNYCPENCKWATMVEQQNNRRNSHYLEYNGEAKTIAQWARTTGLAENTIRSRLNYGWSVEKTLTEPVNEKSRNNRRKHHGI